MSKADTLRSADKRSAKDAARQQARINKGKYSRTRYAIRFYQNGIEFEKETKRG